LGEARPLELFHGRAHRGEALAELQDVQAGVAPLADRPGGGERRMAIFSSLNRSARLTITPSIPA
jgi:hypothetical protein